jgi:large-conductance mechanosensitive channel
MRKLTWIRPIAILYCIVVIPALSIVYGINYGKYNQTILLFCIIGLDIFLTYQIISLFFSSEAQAQRKLNGFEG